MVRQRPLQRRLRLGNIEVRANYRDTDHEMNFLADKGGMADGGMPMNTRCAKPPAMR